MKSDAESSNDVMAELAREPSLVAESIGVGARDGIATLGGHAFEALLRRSANRT
jgi:hypothetical protein